jgi:glutamate synthase domain-containing protein 2
VQRDSNKMAQGAKPEDSYLEKSSAMDRRGTKLNAICWINFTTTHHDIYSIEDLSQLIFDLKMPTVKHV